MRVWVTRAQPGAQATAGRLKALGHTPLVAPLLSVEPTSTGELPLDGIGALAFTSANAVRAFAARQDGGRGLRTYAVGGATAEAARAAGFGDVRSAGGDVAALAAAIAADPPTGRLLHPCAEVMAGDLAGDLRTRGIAARAQAIYRTTACATLPVAAAEALAGDRLDAVLLHSPRAAEALREVAGDRLQRLEAFGLSPACLAPLSAVALAGRWSAAQPTEDALLALLT